MKILLSTNANRLNNVRLPNYCFYLSILNRKFLLTFYDTAFAHAQEYKLYIVWFHILSTVITTLIVVFNGNFKCLFTLYGIAACPKSTKFLRQLFGREYINLMHFWGGWPKRSYPLWSITNFLWTFWVRHKLLFIYVYTLSKYFVSYPLSSSFTHLKNFSNRRPEYQIQQTFASITGVPGLKKASKTSEATSSCSHS